MLVTDWKTIGTAGDTIDGREITEQDLIDAAETYDKEEYTAVINSDHALWLYGNFGHVEEVRLGTDKKGRTNLQAKISPNSRLMEKNKNGQGMFFSMELWPNFAKSGQTYLSGLAVTDESASLGTSMLKLFSKQPGGKPDRIYAKPASDSFNLNEFNSDPIELSDEEQGFIRRLFTKFKSDPASESQPPATDPSEDDMSKELLEKIQQQNEQLSSAFTSLANSMNKHFSVETKEETPAPEGKKTEEETPEAVTSEQFNTLVEQNTKLQEAVTGMAETFSKLLEERPGTKAKPNEGDANVIDFV